MLPSILVYTILWGVGFAVGLIMGFSVPVLGDVIAVLVVGVLVIGFQVRTIPDSLDDTDWLKRTIIGLIIGTALSFFLILITHRLGLLRLENSHIVGFPIIILVIGLMQYSMIAKNYSSKLAIKYVLLTTISVVLAMSLLGLFSIWYDLKIGLLQIRQRDYSATLSWGIMGATLGLFYSLTITYLFRDMTN